MANQASNDTASKPTDSAVIEVGNTSPSAPAPVTSSTPHSSTTSITLQPINPDTSCYSESNMQHSPLSTSATANETECVSKENDPELVAVLVKRKLYVVLGATSVLLMGLLLMYLMILGGFYLTALWDPTHNFPHMKVGVVSYDEGIPAYGINLGEQIMAEIVNTNVFKFQVLSESLSVEDFQNSVANHHYWEILAFPTNFTLVLIGSFTGLVQSINNTYTNPVLDIYDEGRQYTTTSLMRKAMSIIFQEINVDVATVLHSGAFGQESASAPMGVIVSPVYRESINLHPVEKYGWYFSPYVTLLILWVVTLFSQSMIFVIFRQQLTKRVRVMFITMVSMRIGSYLVLSFFLGLFATFIVSWYDIPIENGSGCLFLYFWLVVLSFMGIMCPLFSYFGVVGIFFATLLFILQLCTCDGVYAREALPPFFRGVGPIFPFFHSVPIFRYVTLGAQHYKLGSHIGVLIAWTFGGVGISIPGWYFRSSEKLLRLVLPVSLDSFDHLTHTM